jgi:hypothetical protein
MCVKESSETNKSWGVSFRKLCEKYRHSKGDVLLGWLVEAGRAELEGGSYDGCGVK